MTNKVLHIICPGGAESRGWVITVLPPCIVGPDDCPVPAISTVSIEPFKPSALFKAHGDEQVSVIVKNISRG